MTLVKLYFTVNFAVPLKLLHDCTAVNSFSVLQQFTVKTMKHNSVWTVRALEHHTTRKLYRSAKTASRRTKIILHFILWCEFSLSTAHKAVQFTAKMSEHNSVCTVRMLKHHIVRKLYRSEKTVSGRTKQILAMSPSYVDDVSAHGKMWIPKSRIKV